MTEVEIVLDLETTPSKFISRPELVVTCDLGTIGAMPFGTKEGRPTVMFIGKHEDSGQVVMMECTLRTLQLAMKAFEVKYGDLVG